MRGWWRGLLAMVAAVVAVGIGSTELGRWLDLRLLDMGMRLLPAAPPSVPVVLIAIDEPSLEAIGRWPWSRRQFARLLEVLRPQAPAAVAFDILFAEPDPDDPAGDAAFAAGIAASGRVVLAVAGTRHSATTPALEVLPEGELAAAAAALGHSNIAADEDGRVRRLRLQAGLGTARWPALAAAALTVAGSGGREPAAGEQAEEAAPGRGWVGAGEVLLPFSALHPHVRRLSFADAVDADATGDPPRLPAGAVILVGATAAGLGNVFPVPATDGITVLPGAEIQAAAIAGLAGGGSAVPLGPRPAALLAALLLTGLVPLLPASIRGLLAAIPLVSAGLLLAAAGLLVVGGAWWSPGPAVLGFVAAAGLETARRWLPEHVALRRMRARAELVLRAISDAVITLDDKGRVTSFNPAAEAILGLPAPAALGQPAAQVLPQPVGELPLNGRLPVRRGPPVASPFDLLLQGKDGTRRELRATMTRFEGGYCLGRGSILTLHDATAERALLREISHRATHDALTGLPNRSLLDDRIDKSLARARRTGELVAIAFVDIDRFKAINDGLGHAAGDTVLGEVAQRLSRTARETDTVGRIGGDEFVLLLEGLSSETAVLAPLQRLQAALSQPIELTGQKIVVSASIGVSLFPRDGTRREELLRCADHAMYQAKQTGRNRIAFCAGEIDARAQDRLWLERELRAGLEGDHFELHYQPRYALDRQQRLAGLEGLVRWRHPERGLIPPGQFVPLAEETGLICPLGRRIVQLAAEALCRWRRLDPELGLSINLSVVQLKADDGFVEFVGATLRQHGLDPADIEFEITESLFLDPALPAIDRRIQNLVGLGVHLAIDDFGTGYSSLGYLRRFPFAAIKIDRSFVQDVAADEGSRAIVEAIIGLGHSLGKRLVAEGVETEDQLGFLARQGCDEAQGFLLGRPLPSPEIPRLLTS